MSFLAIARARVCCSTPSLSPMHDAVCPAQENIVIVLAVINNVHFRNDQRYGREISSASSTFW